MIFKGACLYFLEWQDSNPEAESKVRKWNGADFFHEIVQSNYIYLLFWYWFTDIGSIYPTSFDLLTYYMIYFWMSLIL